MIYNERPILLTLKEKMLINVQDRYSNNCPSIEHALKDYQDYNRNDAFEYVYNYFYPKLVYMTNSSNVSVNNKEELLGELLVKFSIITKSYIPSNINFNTYFYYCINNAIKAFNVKNNAKKRSLCATVSMNNINNNTENQEEYEIADVACEDEFEQIDVNYLLENTINRHLNKKWQDIIKMVVNGYTYTDIGKKYNMSKNVISARICVLRKTIYFQRLYRILKSDI